MGNGLLSTAVTMNSYKINNQFVYLNDGLTQVSLHKCILQLPWKVPQCSYGMCLGEPSH